LRGSAEEISELFRLHRIEIIGHGALTLEPTQTLLLAFLAFQSLPPWFPSPSATTRAQVLAVRGPGWLSNGINVSWRPLLGLRRSRMRTPCWRRLECGSKKAFAIAVWIEIGVAEQDVAAAQSFRRTSDRIAQPGWLGRQQQAPRHWLRSQPSSCSSWLISGLNSSCSWARMAGSMGLV